MKPLTIPFLLLCCLGFVSCNQPSTETSEPTKKSDVDRFLKDFNKSAALEELDQIDLLLARYEWPVTETGTGIRYWVYEKGKGRHIKNGDQIKTEYTLHLINGNEIYNSINDGPLKLEVGNSNITPGMAEIIQQLHEGDAAKIIIPSHLGYGLAGDGNKIPSRSTLIYDLKKIRIINKTN